MSPCQCLCWCGSVHPNLAHTKMSGCDPINRYQRLEGRLEYPWMVNSVQQSCKTPWELAISCFFVNQCSIEMERYMKSVLQETLLDISLVMIQGFFVYFHILNVQRNYEIESCNQITHLTSFVKWLFMAICRCCDCAYSMCLIHRMMLLTTRLRLVGFSDVSMIQPGVTPHETFHTLPNDM